MTIPATSHLQTFLLWALTAEPRYGETLRKLLRQEGHEASGPAFYQLMGRMEEAGLVRSRIAKSYVDTQLIKERVYKITAAGRAELRAVRELYDRMRKMELKAKPVS